MVRLTDCLDMTIVVDCNSVMQTYFFYKGEGQEDGVLKVWCLWDKLSKCETQILWSCLKIFSMA